jgi:hypothetical protein
MTLVRTALLAPSEQLLTADRSRRSELAGHVVHVVTPSILQRHRYSMALAPGLQDDVAVLALGVPSLTSSEEPRYTTDFASSG